jgi:hypothetical protein
MRSGQKSLLSWRLRLGAASADPADYHDDINMNNFAVYCPTAI